MKIKPFLLITYGIAGLTISLFSAFMTYIIIDEPIGFKMTSQITLVVLSTLPIIGILSYFIGVYLSKKFTSISMKLDTIDANIFEKDEIKDSIVEINTIHDSIDHLSKRVHESVIALKTNNENLSSVIKSLSHDIKTPLMIMHGYIEEFEDGLIKEEDIAKVIEIFKKETMYLNELSSEVLGYIHSQEELNQVQEKILLKDFLHKEVCPLVRICDDVELRCELEDNAVLTFNRISLKKILVNLLHNASKYTSNGTIVTKIKENKIIVEDTGVGIKENDSKIIFNPFVSLDESRNREKNSFGLGLAIANNLAKKNGYILYLDNSYTKGCRFVLEKNI